MNYITKNKDISYLTVFFFAIVYIVYTINIGLNEAYSDSLLNTSSFKPKILEIKVNNVTLKSQDEYYELLRSVGVLADEVQCLSIELESKVCL